MIINDTYQFVFIHIPKCAGTAIRSQLKRFDETHNQFARLNVKHPQLGPIDYGHIPLFILRQYFHVEYDKVRNYFSFAVIRDPFDRFPSSVSQNLRMYGDRPIQNMKASEIKRAIDKTIRVLQDHIDDQSYLPYQYIHFQRQVDFVYDGGDCLVSKLYEAHDMPIMLSDIGKRIGVKLDQSGPGGGNRANETMVYRNHAVRALTGMVMPILKVVLRAEARRKLRDKSRGLFFVPRDKKLRELFDSHEVRNFIASYYAADIILVSDLRSRNAEKS